jgi:hypothetical protein
VSVESSGILLTCIQEVFGLNLEQKYSILVEVHFIPPLTIELT